MINFEQYAKIGKEKGLSNDQIKIGYKKYRNKVKPNHPDFSTISNTFSSQINSNERDTINSLNPNEKNKFIYKKYLESKYGQEFSDEMVDEYKKKYHPDLEDYTQVLEVEKAQNNYEPYKSMIDYKPNINIESYYDPNLGNQTIENQTTIEPSEKEIIINAITALGQGAAKFPFQIGESLGVAGSYLYNKLSPYNIRKQLQDPNYDPTKIINRFDLLRDFSVNTKRYLDKDSILAENRLSLEDSPEGLAFEMIGTEVLANQGGGKLLQYFTKLITKSSRTANRVAGVYFYGGNHLRLRQEAYDRAKNEYGFDEDSAQIFADSYGFFMAYLNAKIDLKQINLGKKAPKFQKYIETTFNVKPSVARRFMADIASSGMLEGFQEGLEEFILQSAGVAFSKGNYDLDAIFKNAAYGALLGTVSGATWGSINTTQQNKLIRNLAKQPNISLEEAKKIVLEKDFDKAQALLVDKIKNQVEINYAALNNQLNSQNEINPNTIPVNSQFQPLTLDDVANINIGEDGRQLTNADLEVYANERIDPKVKSLFLNLIKNPNEANLKLYNEATESIYLKEEERARNNARNDDFDQSVPLEDVEILDEIKDPTIEEIEEANEIFRDDEVVEETEPTEKKLKPEQVTEEQLNDLTDEDVEILEEDLKIYEEDTNIEEEELQENIEDQGAEVIEEVTIVSDKNIFEEFNDSQLAEYVAEHKIYKIPLSDELNSELLSRIKTPNDLTLFNSAVQSYIKSKDIGKTFNTSGSIPNVLLDTFGANKVVVNNVLNEKGIEKFVEALNKMQSSIRNKPNEYWLDQANKWISYVNRTPKLGYIKERWQKNNITKQQIADSMRNEDPASRRQELSNLLLQPVYDGNVELVERILKEQGIDLTRPFAKRIMTATKLFKQSYAESRAENSPMVNKLPSEIKTPIKNEPIPKAVEEQLGVSLFVGQDYSLSSRQEIQDFVNKTGLDENTAITLFGDAYDNNVKVIGTGIILDKSIPPSEEKIEGTNFPISFSGATFVEKIIKEFDDTYAGKPFKRKDTIFIFKDITGKIFKLEYRDIYNDKTVAFDMHLVVDDLIGVGDTIRVNAERDFFYKNITDIESRDKWFGENYQSKYITLTTWNLSPSQIEILKNRILEKLQEKYGDFYIVDGFRYKKRESKKTVKELKEIAKKNNIKIPSKSNKEDIINILLDNGYSVFIIENEERSIKFGFNSNINTIKSFDIWSNKAPSYVTMYKEYYKLLTNELIDYQSELGSQVDVIIPESISEIDKNNITLEGMQKMIEDWSGIDIGYMPSDQKAEEMFIQTLNNLQKISPTRSIAPLEMLNILNENIPQLLYLIKRGRITFAEVNPEQWAEFGHPDAMALFTPSKFGRQIVLNPNGVFETNEQKLQAFMHEMGHYVDFRFIRDKYGDTKAKELQKKWDDHVDRLVKENPKIDKRLEFVTNSYASNKFQSEYFAEVFSYYMLGKMTTIQLEQEGEIPDIIPESMQLMEEILQELNDLTTNENYMPDEYVEPIPVSKFKFGNFQPRIDVNNPNQGLPNIQELKFDNPPSVRQILEAADAIYTDYELKLNLENLNLTEKEMEISMLYLAQRQDVTYEGYDPVTEDQLPKQVRELLDGELGWDSISKDIDEQLKRISEELNLAYSSRAEFYFPLLWMNEGANTFSTIEDLVLEASGITKSRKATKFEPVIKNPAEQLKKYLKNFSILKATANAIRSQRADIRENIIETAEAVVDSISNPVIDNIIDEDTNYDFIPDEDYIPADFEEGTIIETEEETETEEEIDETPLEEREEFGEDVKPIDTIVEKNIPIPETKVKITPSGAVLVNKVKTLSEIEKWGESKGIPKSALSSFEIYNLINMHQKDGGGKQMPTFDKLPLAKKTKDLLAEKFNLDLNGRDWAITIDPYLVVQTMDNLNIQEDGKIYGANSVLLSRIFRDVATEQELQTQVKEEQVSVHRPLKRNKKTLDKLNDIMHEALVSDQNIRKLMFDSKDLPNAAAISKILQISIDEAVVVEWHRNQLIKFRRGIGLFENIRSDLSLIQKENRIKFTELERKVYEGIATEQEVYQYLSYAPKIPKGTNLSTADGKIVEQKRNIMRNAIRWFFEKEAINSNNFYSFFDSIVSMGIKGDQYSDTIAAIEEWATYLENIGQEDNAKWWRLRIDKNIKGNLFKFEDHILDIVSGVSEKGFKGKNDKNLEFTGSGLDPLRNVDPDNIKKNIVSALNIIQGAAIARSLGGNFAWSLITQPSSLAFTIMKTGFKKTFGAIYSVGFKTEPEQKSNVSRIKGFKKANKGIFSAVEATGTWSDTGTKRGKRAVFRDKLGLIQSGIESWTTSVSYSAGYQYGLSMGLSEDQARIHGDFVAATTQTMYDQVTRNSALNSKFLRAMFPFQSYVFTAYSNGLDIGGVIGTKRSAKQRWGIELARWLVASKAWWFLWSYIFGDSVLKAIFNPTIDKATPGSFVPLFGKNIDIAVSKALPWMDDKEWQGDLPHAQFAKHTTKVLKNALEQDENWERELAIYFNTYVLPLGGVGGSVPVNNFIKTFDARVNDNYRYETAAGDTYRKMRRDSELVWINGILFGVKGADEYTAFGKKQTLKKEKD